MAVLGPSTGTLFALSFITTCCFGCTNRLIGVYTGVSDLSTTVAPEDVATVTANTWRFDCAIAGPDPARSGGKNTKPAKKLIVDPGPVEMRVVCESPINSWHTEQVFEFTATAGHRYRVIYGLSMCMRLQDTASDTIVANFCE